MATVTSERPLEEPVDLLAPRAERHGAVEHRDAVGVQAVDLAREREHRLAAEGDDDRSRREAAERALADELERQHALEDLHLGLRERVQHERLGIERTEHEDVAVVAGEQEPRPGRAALGVVRPLHLVEHEHLARARRHLDRAADDRRRVVDALLAGDEADGVLPELGREPAVGLLREHPQRPRVDAAAALLEHLERVVGLAGVRRAEVGDDRLRLHAPRRQGDLDRALRARDRGVHAGGAGALVALRTARALRPAASLSASAGHGMSVAGRRGSQGSGQVAHASVQKRIRGRYALTASLAARPSGSGAASCRSRALRPRGRWP